MFRNLKLEQGQKVLSGRMVFISDLLPESVFVPLPRVAPQGLESSSAFLAQGACSSLRT